MGEEAGALMQQLRLNVARQSRDWGTPSSRARSKHPKVSAGSRCYGVGRDGLWPTNPGSNIPLSGDKPKPAMKASCSACFDASDFAGQRRLAERMPVLGLREPPFIPPGQYP